MSVRHRSPSPARDSDDYDGMDLGVAVGRAIAHFANSSEIAEGSSRICITAAEESESREHSTGDIQPDEDDSHATRQRQASDDILKLLGVVEVDKELIITMLHIRRNRRYRVKVKNSSTMMELATVAAVHEGVGVEKINLLQDNVVNVFCGDSYTHDGKGDTKLEELGLNEDDRINVAVGAQVAVFPRSEWDEDVAGNLKLKGTPWQRFQELQRQRAEAKRRDSANP